MPRRSYQQDCSIAAGLDVLGERWTLLLVRELLLGPQRFSDLLGSLDGIGPNTLAARLKGMEADGLVTRRRLPPPAGSVVYELTGRGRALEPVLVELARWGRSLLPEKPHATRPGWVVIGLKTAFDPEGLRHAGVTADRELTYQLQVGEERYVVTIRGRSIDVARGEHRRPDATVVTDQETLYLLGNGRLRLADAVADGRFRIEGDRTAVRAWGRAFTVVPPSVEVSQPAG